MKRLSEYKGSEVKKGKKSEEEFRSSGYDRSHNSHGSIKHHGDSASAYHSNKHHSPRSDDRARSSFHSKDSFDYKKDSHSQISNMNSKSELHWKSVSLCK